MQEVLRPGAATNAAPGRSPSRLRIFTPRALLWTTSAVVVLAIAARLDPVPHGLNGSYFANTTWTSPVLASSIDPVPSSDAFGRVFGGQPPEHFSASWTGTLLVPRGGRYTFATVSDDGSMVFVDGHEVVDNGGRHGPQQASGTIALASGVHAIFVEYNQDGGGLALELLWARDGRALHTIESWALAPRHAAFGTMLASAAVAQALVFAEWAWIAAILLAIAVAAWWAFRRCRAWLVADGAWPAVAWIALASTILNVTGVWWGLPGGSWAPDEITPASVLGGVALRFSHGWYNAYPPFHFYLLAAAFSPMLLLEWLGRTNLNAATPYLILAIVGRLLTSLQALGTVLAAYACGARAFGRRAGIWAAAIFALNAPFLYYSKTTNFDVPYLFWFALSLVFYLRILQAPAARDLVGFAIAATLSVCTKDQAYGLYVLPPLAIIYRMWEIARERGDRAPLKKALLDGRLIGAGAVAVVLFAACHNLPFNAHGFVLHIEDITGTRSSGYQMFPKTVAGRLGLLRLTIDLLRLSMAWPLFVICGAGTVFAIASARYRRVALWLIVPAASYYLAFLDVVLYTYDRFLLPICFVLALFGGLAIDRFAAVRVSGRAWRRAAIGLVFAYTFLYSATVDVLMVRDSRYVAARWLASNVRADDLVAFTFPLQYYPVLERYRAAEIDSVADLGLLKPEYFILDEDYAHAEPPTSLIGRMLAGLKDGTLGYHVAFRFRRPDPWPWLPGGHPDLVGPRQESHIYSTLHHVNPTIEIFKRDH